MLALSDGPRKHDEQLGKPSWANSWRKRGFAALLARAIQQSEISTFQFSCGGNNLSVIARLYNSLRSYLHNRSQSDQQEVRATLSDWQKVRATLRSMGIEAELKPRYAREEYIIRRWWGEGKSEGVIAIESGPISWVNLRKKKDTGDLPTLYFYYADYGVSDARLAGKDLSKLQIESYKIRDFPLVGKVLRVSWRGNDLGLEILRMLNDQATINEWLVDLQEVEIRAHSADQCWTLSTYDWPSSLQEWQCLEAIACCLLSELPQLEQKTV